MSFSIESISSKHDINLQKLLSVIVSPNFTESDLNRQKSIIRNELLALKNNKKRELFYEVILSQNKNFPDLESQIRSLDNITLSDIEEYYDRFFVLENLTILSSGGESYEKDIEQIILTSGLWKGDRTEIENRFKLDSSFITKDFGSLSKFMGVYSFDFLAGTNNKANFEFLAFILRRKLYYALRSKGLIYRLSCYVSEGSIFGKSIIILECDFISGNQSSLIGVVEEEISRAYAISKEEFNLLKKEFRDYLIFNSQTPEQNNSFLRIRKFIYSESDD